MVFVLTKRLIPLSIYKYLIKQHFATFPHVSLNTKNSLKKPLALRRSVWLCGVSLEEIQNFHKGEDDDDEFNDERLHLDETELSGTLSWM